VISILAVPDEKDYEGVYRELGAISQEIILTESRRNQRLHFLEPATALAVAQQYNAHATYAPGLESAVEQAKARAGRNGTILIVGTQSIIADAMELWGRSFEQI
jgi:dihydrofolate synthase/folylpolyglutamate synthase